MNVHLNKEKDKIIIEIPYWSPRHNPYMEGEDVGQHKTLVGIIIYHKEEGNDYDEVGFANVIDMDHADKDDQHTDIKYHWWGDVEEFKRKCQELGIGCIEYPNCDYCGRPLFGSFAMKDGKNICFKCEKKENK